MTAAKIKEQKSKHKKSVPLFLYLADHMHMYPSVCFHFHATDLLKQYLK